MENHPIPQDVTGFQFKIIGNMTIKQFAYLGTGVVLAWLTLQLPINAFIKIPFCAIFAFLGFGLAYLPISGRPMDAMIGNFIKALFRPTQFVYEKSGMPIYHLSKTAYPSQQNHKIEQPIQAAISQTVPQVNPQIIPQIIPKSVTAFQQLDPIKKIISAPKDFTNTGMPSVPDFPNLITGVTKDPRGNTLPNILIEIKDKDSNPVRAFKTNEVGRFASATPLQNGNYIVQFDDPKSQNKFETKTISLTGQIVLPIIAISIDTREELRRSLFAPGASGLSN